MNSPIDVTLNPKKPIEKSPERAPSREKSPEPIKEAPPPKKEFSPPKYKKEAPKVVPPWLIGGMSPEKVSQPKVNPPPWQTNSPEKQAKVATPPWKKEKSPERVLPKVSDGLPV